MRKLRIDRLVGVVVLLFVREPVRKVMKQWPQRPIAVAVVVGVEFGGLQVDSGEPDIPACDHLRVPGRRVRCLAAPAEPRAPRMTKGGKNPDGQAARRSAASR